MFYWFTSYLFFLEKIKRQSRQNKKKKKKAKKKTKMKREMKKMMMKKRRVEVEGERWDANGHGRFAADGRTSSLITRQEKNVQRPRGEFHHFNESFQTDSSSPYVHPHQFFKPNHIYLYGFKKNINKKMTQSVQSSIEQCEINPRLAVVCWPNHLKLIYKHPPDYRMHIYTQSTRWKTDSWWNGP